MNKNITKIDNSGLFDSIRHLDDDGVTEYWWARELMPLLGYIKWERFGAKESDHRRVSAVCRAIISCSNSNGVVSSHFTHFPMRGSGLDSMLSDKIPEDWKLSRFACYLTAMNGDVTKPRIAAAQAYFVTKAREAELFATNQPQTEQSDRPNLDTFTIYDLKPWQIERLVVAIGYRENDESIPAEYLEGMDDLDMPIWEIPFEVINWLQSLHQDLIEEFLYRKCLENNKLANNKVLQEYIREFEANAAIRDYSEVRDMAESIASFEKIQLVEKEFKGSKSAKSKSLGFGKK
jgi:hypothetical protein